MARQTKKSPEVIKTICEQLAQGIPLTVICREEGMPNPATVWQWQQDDPEIRQAIAQARERGEEALAEQCLEIADDEKHDWQMSQKGTITDEVAISRAKLRIHTRLQLLAKFNPKRWGDRQQVEHSGKVGLEHLVAGDD